MRAIKRYLPVVWILIIFCFLCGCIQPIGIKSSSNTSNQFIEGNGADGTIYQGTIVTLPSEHFIISKANANETSICIHGHSLEDQEDTLSFYIYSLKGNQEKVISVPAYSKDTKKNIMSMLIDSAGSIWLLEYFTSYGTEAHDSATSGDIISWNIECFDKNGSLLFSFGVGDGNEQYTDFIVNQKYILISGSEGIKSFDRNGNQISFTKDTSIISALVSDTDSEAFIVSNKLGKKSISSYDIVGGKNSSVYEIPDNTNRVILDNYLGFDFILEIKGSLYGVDKSSDNTYLITNLVDYNIMHNAKGIVSLNDGSFMVYSAQQLQIFRPTTDDSSIVQLTLGTLDSRFLADMVEKFNSTNSGYRINILDYSQYNLSEYSSEGLMKLNTEIVAGKGPDILDLYSLPASQYERAGILVDLYPFISSDEQTKNIEFVEPVMRVLERDGKLYKLVPAYSLMTFIGSDIFVKDSSMTLEALVDFSFSGKNPFYRSMSKKDFLECIMNSSNPPFINYNDNSCDFNNQLFVNLLRFMNSLPDSNEIGYEMTDIMSGDQLLSRQFFSSYYSIPEYDYLFNGSLCLAGLPVGKGSGTMVCPYMCLGISQNCQNKEGAWEFLKQYLLEEYQNRAAEDKLPLPITQSSFDLIGERYNDWLEKGGQMWVLDEKGRDNYLQVSGNSAFEKMDHLLDSISCFYNNDIRLSELIWECISPFFRGEKGPEEVASITQSRISLFLSEQYG